MSDAPNRNLLAAQVFAEELVRAGVEHAVIAPGSRSTPLVLALAAQPSLKLHSVIDERGAAFFALGIGLATGKPAALVCSSGTATANFYPAIVEAHYSRVPMLILTADRPHELRDSGANQTVDQVKLYGSHVLWTVDVALPEAQPSALATRALRTLASRAVATAVGLPSGPVHLNFPFRKPLEPLPVETGAHQPSAPARVNGLPFTQILRGSVSPSGQQTELFVQLVNAAQRILVVAGPRTPDGDFARQLSHFAEVTGAVVLADPLSNLRYSPDISVIGAYDALVPAGVVPPTPDLVIQVGAPPASKALEDFFASTDFPAHILLTEDGTWTDPFHRLTHMLQSQPAALLEAALPRLSVQAARSEWQAAWLRAEQAAWHAIRAAVNASDRFDGAAVHALLEALPDGINLFVASSLSVRHVEQYGQPRQADIRIFCNRGASGIDGTIASALGVAAASERPTVLLIGDVALYHDLNSLLAAHRTGSKLITILLNNEGGGIFRRLPIVDFEPQFSALFLTPTGLDFQRAAELFGLDYHLVAAPADLVSSLRAALKAENSTLIEFRTASEDDLRLRKVLVQRITAQLKRASLSSSQSQE